MPNCKFCGQPVTSAPVYHPECLEKQAAGGWISVEDRLPEEWVEVLVFVPGVGCEIAWFCGAVNLWRWVWTGESVTLDVTHWMPLPEPPKEDNHE